MFLSTSLCVYTYSFADVASGADNNEVVFHLQLFQTVMYSEHYHAFVVYQLTDFTTVKSSEVLSHLPVHVCSTTGLTKAGQKAIVLKHHFSIL